MAVSVSSSDIKNRLMMSVSTYDTQLGAIGTEVANAISAAIDSACGSTYDNVLKHGAVDIAAGESWNALRRLPGFADAVTISGIAMGQVGEAGDAMIATGWQIVKPFLKENYQRLLANNSIAAYDKAMAEARDDYASQVALAEKDQKVSEAAKVASEKLKIDAETSLVTAETTTEAAKASKMAADESLSTALASESGARTDIKAVELARMNAEDASILVDGASESHSDYDGQFAVDSEEYI